MPLYKTNRGWYGRLNYTNTLGEHKTKSTRYFETKREAQEELIKLSSIKDTFQTSNCTLKSIYPEFLEYKKDNVKTSTWITYKSMYDHCKSIENIKLKDMSVSQFKAFREELTNKGLSVPRKNKIIKFVGQLISYANSMYDLNCNVVNKVGGFKELDKIRTKNVDFYTYDEFNKFIKEIDDIKYHTLFMVLYYQGLRIGEANALTWYDVDFNNHTLNINKTVNTKIKGMQFMVTSTKKTASDRVLPLEEDTEEELKKLFDYFSQFKNFKMDWFCFGGARPFGESYIHTVKNNASNKANLKHIRIHDFRHSCASFLINIGCQPMIVQKYLGHASLKITMDTYSHMYPNQLDTATIMIKQFKDNDYIKNK